ncbi:MAG: hypothetical protein NTX01_04715 [Candidatus Omnitrophica bacterium]|nr:hypothetical protein [Candidatus Omnitrophota bacterium]
MHTIELLGSTLIIYNDLLEHLRSKGKSKNWFDAIRTRYGMRHEPIIKPYDKLISSGRKSKHGRRIFYLRAILPYLDEIIDLHDKDGLTYPEIKIKMQDKTDALKRLRDADLNVDEHMELESFFFDFQIAKAKLGSFYDWGNDSQDMKLLNHIYQNRQAEGERYFELTKKIQRLIAEGHKAGVERLKEERNKVGDTLNYCRAIMIAAIQHCADLIKKKKIDIREEDKEYARSAILE